MFLAQRFLVNDIKWKASNRVYDEYIVSGISANEKMMIRNNNVIKNDILSMWKCNVKAGLKIFFNMLQIGHGPK